MNKVLAGLCVVLALSTAVFATLAFRPAELGGASNTDKYQPAYFYDQVYSGGAVASISLPAGATVTSTVATACNNDRLSISVGDLGATFVLPTSTTWGSCMPFNIRKTLYITNATSGPFLIGKGTVDASSTFLTTNGTSSLLGNKTGKVEVYRHQSSSQSWVTFTYTDAL